MRKIEADRPCGCAAAEALMSATPQPPSYEETTSVAFPQGYFIIRSRATGRVLDVDESRIDDGTELILWEDREQSHVLSEQRNVLWSHC